jgi:dTDP-4-amino-4,6-dideoxygalactose transaminase
MISSVSDLAYFGGTPAFREQLHVGRPNVGNRNHFIARVNDILERRWFTNDGPYVQEFEKRLALLVGTRHCVATCNATIALELVIRASELQGEVILPSFTFIATAHALQWHNVVPVFCDVAPHTHHIDPDGIEALITPRTTGIIGVHVWGCPCNVTMLEDIARRRRLKLVFDAAHALACTYQGRMIGGFGDAEVFSFHATKFINSFEGGAITTNSDDMAQKLRYLRNFGFAEYDRVDDLGINAKLTEIAAAMGITSLESMSEVIARNRQNYDTYSRCLSDIPGIMLFRYNQAEQSNYQYVVIESEEEVTGISRDDIVRILHAENILARRYFYPGCHQMEPYRSHYPPAGVLLPRTASLVTRVMSLPTGTTVTPEQIEKVCDICRYVVTHGASIRKLLRALQ